jgi:hypothetical protein
VTNTPVATNTQIPNTAVPATATPRGGGAAGAGGLPNTGSGDGGNGAGPWLAIGGLLLVVLGGSALTMGTRRGSTKA